MVGQFGNSEPANFNSKNQQFNVPLKSILKNIYIDLLHIIYAYHTFLIKSLGSIMPLLNLNNPIFRANNISHH